MAQINLSPSSGLKKEERRVGVFDQSFLIILSGFIVIVLAWLGMEGYLKKIESDTARIDQQIIDSAPALRSASVNRVADIDNRMVQTGKGLESVAMPEAIAKMVESSLLPSILVVQLKYVHAIKQVEIAAVTDTFKSFGEQYQGLKADNRYTDVKLFSVGLNEEGKVGFIVQVTLK